MTTIHTTVTPSIAQRHAPPETSEPPTAGRVLADCYDPDNHALRLCDRHEITLTQLADLLTGAQVDRAAANIRRIAEARLAIIRAEAEIAAWARLMDLAGNFPTTPRDRETARKAAAQILRELKKTDASGAGGDQPPDRPKGDAEAVRPPRPGAGGYQPPDRPKGDASPSHTGTGFQPVNRSHSGTGFQPVNRPKADPSAPCATRPQSLKCPLGDTSLSDNGSGSQSHSATGFQSVDPPRADPRPTPHPHHTPPPQPTAASPQPPPHRTTTPDPKTHRRAPPNARNLRTAVAPPG